MKKRREQIVRAAIKCFSQKGFHKTTLPDLAAEAGISHGGIYKYISTKEEILSLIHAHLTSLVFGDVERTIDHYPDPVERLRRIIHDRLDAMQDTPGAFLLMYQEANAMTGDLLKSSLKDERRNLALVEDVIEEGIRQGRLRNISPCVASNLMSLVTDCWELKRWDLRGQVGRAEFEQMAVECFFHGLVREKTRASDAEWKERTFSRKSVLILNAAGRMGADAVAAFLVRGAKVTAYSDRFPPKWERRFVGDQEASLYLYSKEECGPLGIDALAKMTDETGPFDCVVQCFGNEPGKPKSGRKTVPPLTKQLLEAREIASALIRRMCERRSGRIIYIAPDYWERINNPTEYEVVTGGVKALAESLAKRAAAGGVCVNCLVPGFVGEMEADGSGDKEREPDWADIPAKKCGDPGDVIEAVLFLAADASRYITGQVIRIDGGYQGPMDLENNEFEAD